MPPPPPCPAKLLPGAGFLQGHIAQIGSVSSSAEPVFGPQRWASKVRSPVHTSGTSTLLLLGRFLVSSHHGLSLFQSTRRVLLILRLAARRSIYLCAATEYPPLSTTTQTFCLPELFRIHCVLVDVQIQCNRHHWQRP